MPRDDQEAAYVALHGPSKKLKTMPNLRNDEAGDNGRLQKEVQSMGQEVSDERPSSHGEAGNEPRIEQPFLPGAMAWMMDGLIGRMNLTGKARRVPGGIELDEPETAPRRKASGFSGRKKHEWHLIFHSDG